MRSKTSFFNPALSKSLLRRFWPLIGGYALIWALLLPLRQIPDFLTGYRAVPAADSDVYWSALRSELGVCVTGGQIMAFVFGVLFAMAVFSYLTNPRATNGLHALPLRRETHFLTAYLTGLGAQLAVQAAVCLLSLAVLAGAGWGSLRYLGLGFLGMALPTVWFYSFGVLCMVFTGQILAAPVFYGILSVLPVGLDLLVAEFAGSFLYGWAGHRSSEWTVTLSPIVRMLTDVRARTPWDEYGRRVSGLMIEGWQYLLVCALAGAVVTLLALLVCRKRRSEETGATVAVRWARPVFQYGVTFCAALALGQLLYSLLFSRNAVNGSFSRAGILACMAAAGLLGFFAAEMLLKKSVRITRRGWRGAAVVTAVMMLFGFALTQDVTGYEGYLPQPEEIESAYVSMSTNHSGSFDTVMAGAEELALTLDAHRAIIDDKARQQRLNGDFDYADEGQARVYFYVTYALKNGRTVRRSYEGIVVYRSELGDPASPAARLNALYNADTAVHDRVLNTSRSEAAALHDGRARLTGGLLARWDSETGAYEELELEARDAERILAAIEADVAAGRGNQSLFGYRQTVASEWSIELYGVNPNERGEVDSIYLHPSVDEKMTETMRLLETIRQTAAPH